MRKTIVIILAVALLGVLGFYAKNNNGSNAHQALANPGPKSSVNSVSKYKEGTHTGNSAETPYGPVQVAVVIVSGEITDIEFLDMPDDDALSSQITRDSQPLLKQAAISAQSSDIDFVSGATSTSYGYQESLQAALDKALK